MNISGKEASYIIIIFAVLYTFLFSGWGFIGGFILACLVTTLSKMYINKEMQQYHLSCF